jgi:hypothetical protein
VAGCHDREGNGPARTARSGKAGPQAHPLMGPSPTAEWANPSSPKEQQSSLRCETAPPPTLFAHARKPASPDRNGRNTRCLQKQSSPYIRKVQHTVLSVAGLKGSISEFELSVIRSRMLDAKHGKAQRGELRISVPIGYIWHREIGLGFDPDLRVQEAVRVIFARFRQHGSARQVLLSLAAEQMHFPRPSDGKKLVSFEWTPIRYRSVISILKNPFYAGAYAYGKSQKRQRIHRGRVQHHFF